MRERRKSSGGPHHEEVELLASRLRPRHGRGASRLSVRRCAGAGRWGWRRGGRQRVPRAGAAFSRSHLYPLILYPCHDVIWLDGPAANLLIVCSSTDSPSGRCRSFNHACSQSLMIQSAERLLLFAQIMLKC